MTRRGASPWWGRISRRAAADLAQEYELSLDTRLLFLVMGTANAAGHAYFPEGVEASLQRADRTTGELVPYGSRHVREVTRDLIEAGALSPHSTRRCLVMTDVLWSTAVAVAREPCPIHGHQMRWTARGWSDASEEACLRDGRLRVA